MKTNERPTPITDAHFTNQGFRNVYTADVDFAKLLERQLAESHEEIARINKSLSNASAIYDSAREKIEEMETRHAAAMLHTQAIVDDANSLSDQRDRLAEALEYIASSGLSARHLERIATEALAAVKGGKQ